MPCTWSLDNTGDTVFKCAHNNEFGESRLSYTQDRLEFGSIRYVPVKEVRILTKFTFHSQLTASSPGWNENFGWSPSLLVPQAPPKDEEHPCSHHAFLPEQEGLHHCDYWRGKKRDAMMNRHKIKQNIVFYSSLLENYTLIVVNPTSKFSHPKVCMGNLSPRYRQSGMSNSPDVNLQSIWHQELDGIHVSTHM